jgi:hypothetical protein
VTGSPRLIGGLTEGAIAGIEETYKQFTETRTLYQFGKDFRQLATVYLPSNMALVF